MKIIIGVLLSYSIFISIMVFNQKSSNNEKIINQKNITQLDQYIDSKMIDEKSLLADKIIGDIFLLALEQGMINLSQKNIDWLNSSQKEINRTNENTINYETKNKVSNPLNNTQINQSEKDLTSTNLQSAESSGLGEIEKRPIITDSKIDAQLSNIKKTNKYKKPLIKILNRLQKIYSNKINFFKNKFRFQHPPLELINKCQEKFKGRLFNQYEDPSFITFKVSQANSSSTKNPKVYIALKNINDISINYIRGSFNIYTLDQNLDYNCNNVFMTYDNLFLHLFGFKNNEAILIVGHLNEKEKEVSPRLLSFIIPSEQKYKYNNRRSFELLKKHANFYQKNIIKKNARKK